MIEEIVESEFQHSCSGYTIKIVVEDKRIAEDFVDDLTNHHNKITSPPILKEYQNNSNGKSKIEYIIKAYFRQK